LRRQCCTELKRTSPLQSWSLNMFESFITPWLNSGVNQCKKLSKRLHEIKQSIQTIVDLVVKGDPSRALMERLAELETERDATELAVAETEIAALPMTFKPDAADNYWAKVTDLKAAPASADAENRAIAYTAIRELTAR
jgi:hypothetical protein